MWVIRGILLFIFMGFGSSCAKFRDSPFSDEIFNPSRDLNIQAQDGLGGVDNDGKIRIAVFGDSHQNYRNLEDVIGEIIEAPDIDFVVNLGDMTNSGYNYEYDQFLDSYTRIHMPIFSVIGNHDAVGAGPEIYEKVFGPSNYYFETGDQRFIFFNSANLEDPSRFNPQWLLDTVLSSTKGIIIFTHVPLQDEERFQGVNKTLMNQVMTNPRVQAVINGHNHIFGFHTENSTQFVQCSRVEGIKWMILEIDNFNLGVTPFREGAAQWVPLKSGF